MQERERERERERELRTSEEDQVALEIDFACRTCDSSRFP